MFNKFNNLFQKPAASELQQQPTVPPSQQTTSTSRVTAVFMTMMKTTVITIIEIISTSTYASRLYQQLKLLSPESQKSAFDNSSQLLQDFMKEQEQQIDLLRNQSGEQYQEERATRMLAILSIDVSNKTIPNLVNSWIQLNDQLGNASQQIINTVKGMFNFKLFGGKRGGKTYKRKHKKSR